MPSSPLRTTFNPAGGVFSFSYPPPQTLDQSHQLLQRLQSLATMPAYAGYQAPAPYAPYQYSTVYNQAPPAPAQTYTLQPPPQKKLPPSPLAVRHAQFAGTSPLPERRPQPPKKPDVEATQENERLDGEGQFIRPLSQVGTLTTTDQEGRVRVIVPCPSGAEDAGDLIRALRISEEYNRLSNAPTITRTTSEKVPNRSELMSQVQRTAWARHTTK